MENSKYYEALYAKYETKSNVLTELINLEAILNLPKGTEHYMSDIHGEAEAFEFILRNGAGNIKEKIRQLFRYRFSERKINKMALLIYYPEIGVEKFTEGMSPEQKDDWYQEVLVDLVALVKHSATKYTRSKVRKALPKSFIYVVEELIYVDNSNLEKDSYYQGILRKLIEMNQAKPLIIGLSKTIQRLVVDHLHLVGDIFDRGPAADKVMDILERHHSVDIQWGNHDILWLGAYSGSVACLLTLLRIAARYNYLYELEASYGLNLRSLFSFADATYGDNPQFRPIKREIGENYCYESLEQLERVHQALAIMQFKVEGEIIKRRPEFEMSHRQFLEQIPELDLVGACFQTVDKENPYALTQEEALVVEALLNSFQNSEKMQRHMKFLLRKGSMYLVYNKHLLFHGCIPVDENGDFLDFHLYGESYKGKALLDLFDYHIRQSAKNPACSDDFHTDMVWYAWSGRLSPLFGKDQMTTFERYFVADKTAHKEVKNPYYGLREEEWFCRKVLKEFGLNSPCSKIINGHTPVKVLKGETPVKANGKLIVIDGGLSKAYQKSTGIAGYTLLNNSYGFQLVTHQPFKSVEHLFTQESEHVSIKKVIDREVARTYIKDTTIGRRLKEQSHDLEGLLTYLA